MIKAGALDEFGKRSSLLSSYPELVEKISRQQKDVARNQGNLFGETDTAAEEVAMLGLYDVEEFSEKEKLMFEKELLGFFLTNHPLSQELENIARYITHQLTELEEEREGTPLKIGGLVSSVKKIVTKKSNQEMAFIAVEDSAGVSIECVVFPKTYEEIKQVLIRDAIVIVEGKLQFKDERPVIIVDTIKRLAN